MNDIRTKLDFWNTLRLAVFDTWNHDLYSSRPQQPQLGLKLNDFPSASPLTSFTLINFVVLCSYSGRSGRLFWSNARETPPFVTLYCTVSNSCGCCKRSLPRFLQALQCDQHYPSNYFLSSSVNSQSLIYSSAHSFAARGFHCRVHSSFVTSAFTRASQLLSNDSCAFATALTKLSQQQTSKYFPFRTISRNAPKSQSTCH